MLTGIGEVGIKVKTFIAKLHHIKVEEKQLTGTLSNTPIISFLKEKFCEEKLTTFLRKTTFPNLYGCASKEKTLVSCFGNKLQFMYDCSPTKEKYT